MVKYSYFIQNNKTGKIIDIPSKKYKNINSLYREYGYSKDFTLNRMFVKKNALLCYSQEFDNGKWGEKEYQ